jgi:SecD/SecF fusion protein
MTVAGGMALLAAGAFGAAAETVCGRSPDVRSLELVYRLQAGADDIAPSAREETVEIVCERLRALGVARGYVHALDDGRIRVVLPYRGKAGRTERVIEQLGAAGRLYFYDWEPNLIGPEHRIGGHPGYAPPAGALRKAKREWRSAGRDVEAPSNARLIYAGAFPTAHAATSLASRVAFDTVLVSEQPLDRLGRIDAAARPGWYALKDRPALSGFDIVNPKQEVNEFGLPSVTFGFTKEGRIAFERVTRAIARRGQAQAEGPVSEREAEALSGHFAIVLDGEVKARPIVNFAENPDGIDGRTGAQISGGFSTLRQAKDLAAMLGTRPLPIDLALVKKKVLSR